VSGEADDFVALFHKQSRRHGAVRAAAHSDCRAFFHLNQSILPAVRWTKQSTPENLPRKGK
jgi:hypothetical protein